MPLLGAFIGRRLGKEPIIEISGLSITKKNLFSQKTKSVLLLQAQSEIVAQEWLIPLKLITQSPPVAVAVSMSATVGSSHRLSDSMLPISPRHASASVGTTVSDGTALRYVPPLYDLGPSGGTSSAGEGSLLPGPTMYTHGQSSRLLCSGALNKSENDGKHWGIRWVALTSSQLRLFSNREDQEKMKEPRTLVPLLGAVIRRSEAFGDPVIEITSPHLKRKRRMSIFRGFSDSSSTPPRLLLMGKTEKEMQEWFVRLTGAAAATEKASASAPAVVGGNHRPSISSPIDTEPEHSFAYGTDAYLSTSRMFFSFTVRASLLSLSNSLGDTALHVLARVAVPLGAGLEKQPTLRRLSNPKTNIYHGATKPEQRRLLETSLWLIENGCSPLKTNQHGETAVSIALRNRDYRLVSCMLRKCELEDIAAQCASSKNVFPVELDGELSSLLAMSRNSSSMHGNPLPSQYTLRPPVKFPSFSYLSIQIRSQEILDSQTCLFCDTVASIQISVLNRNLQLLESSCSVCRPMICEPTYLLWGFTWHMQVNSLP